ncbi:MAG: cupin domain-containing protein [bacterium]
MPLFKVKLDDIASSKQLEEPWQAVMLTEIDDFVVNMVKIEGEGAERVHPGHDELFVGYKGEAIVKIDGEEFPIREGDTVVVKKGQRHSAVSQGVAIVLSIKDMSLLAKETAV